MGPGRLHHECFLSASGRLIAEYRKVPRAKEGWFVSSNTPEVLKKVVLGSVHDRPAMQNRTRTATVGGGAGDHRRLWEPPEAATPWSISGPAHQAQIRKHRPEAGHD